MRGFGVSFGKVFGIAPTLPPANSGVNGDGIGARQGCATAVGQWVLTACCASPAKPDSGELESQHKIGLKRQDGHGGCYAHLPIALSMA